MADLIEQYNAAKSEFHRLQSQAKQGADTYTQLAAALEKPRGTTVTPDWSGSLCPECGKKYAELLHARNEAYLRMQELKGQLETATGQIFRD
jgi:hypothetical protein